MGRQEVLVICKVPKNDAFGSNTLRENGILKINQFSRIRSIISKGPKYRLPSQIDFNKCREEIAVDLNEFCKRWCRREHVEL